MTFRTKPVVKRSHRPSWESDDRRNLFTNIGFGLAVLIGIAALVGAGVATYVGEHFAEVASVNGTKISKDQFRDRAKVDAFRIDRAEAQARDQLQLGRITDSEAQTRLAVYEQQRQSLAQSTLEQLIDVALQGQLAAGREIVVDDPKIDQRLVDEATNREQRHVLLISVKPEITAGAKEPSEAQKAAAKATADKALADIRAGKPFAEIAKAVSTDGWATAGGDIGWALADDASYAEGFLAAVFALPSGRPDRGPRRPGRHVPDRQGHRDRPPDRRRRLGPADRGGRHPDPGLPRRRPRRPRPRRAHGEGRRGGHRAALGPAAGQRDLHLDGELPGPG